MRASDVHVALGDAGWFAVLEKLGVPAECLVNRHGPCPICGGKDRFRFDGRGRGTWICTHCGAGDGFKLAQLFHRWSFSEARRRVIDAAGLAGSAPADAPSPGQPSRPREHTAIARPTGRVAHLLRTSAPIDAVPDVVDYLAGRLLWPLPAGTTLRAHAGAEYFEPGDDGRPVCIGRFPALIAPVHDVAGELVTAHVTYLADGRKLEGRAPRKLLGKLTGRRGCAVRITPASAEVIGIAEGLESAVAASRLHDGMTVWSALNATLLAKFEPPPGVWRVIVFADRDVAGLEAALALHEQLDGRASVETRTPPAPANDWADVLAERER